MAAMKWRMAPDSLVKRFDEVLPKESAIERRSMFGYPCAFVGGHMFCGLFQDHFILRLPADGRATFLKKPGAAIFEPMPGRPMKEYVVVPPAILANDSSLAPWLSIARTYALGLPPKQKKPKKAAKKAAKKIVKKPAARKAKKPARRR